MTTVGTLTGLAEISFWLCTAGVVYVYAGYPLLIWLLARAFGKTQRPVEPTTWPALSIIIAAHNEESVIGERVRNLLALDYPKDKLDIIIASDGSTDRTNKIVEAFASPSVRLLAFAQNRGKATVLNDAFAVARGEIAILSDANTAMDGRAAKRLVRWFRDPRVGVVCGRLILIDPVNGENVDGIYWKYETFLKLCEARLGALLGANGALYAIRTSAYPGLPTKVAVDDFVIPLLARIRYSLRIEYEAEAIAYEETAPEIRAEFSRRSRIGAGGLQSLSLLWPLMNPLRGWISLSFVSHKVLRWFCPFFLIGSLALSALLASSPLYRMALAAQVTVYLAAIAGYIWPALVSSSRIAKLPTMFAAMNLALLVGFFRWAGRRQQGTWTRTVRTNS